MEHYNDCISYTTGLSAPHTLCINNRNISILYGNVLPYYMAEGFKKIATATDIRKINYSIYANVDGIIAIPEK